MSHKPSRRFLAKTVTVAALAGATIAVSATTAGAVSNCAQLASAISIMEKASQRSYEAGYDSIGKMRHETALYYLSLMEGQGCI